MGLTRPLTAGGGGGGEGDYLPLAGGTMDAGADIAFANFSAIREAGAQGLEIECSVGYRWQWVAGRMILRQVNSGQIARILAIDNINPAATDDITEGFVPGTRWETVDGTVYVCTDSTEDAAVWELEEAAELLEPTTAYELPNPAAGTFRGQRIKYHIQPDGAAIDLTINASIAIPSDSGITFPKTLADGNTYIVALEWIGSKWMLTTVIGGGI